MRNQLVLHDEIHMRIAGQRVAEVLGCTRYEWCQAAYRMFHEQAARVSWADVVWQRTCIPKHSFVSWLAIQGCLNTKDRLLRHGV